MRAVLIDDEAHCRDSLRELITNYTTGIDLVDEAIDVASGIKCIQQNNPDLVFLDVEMPDGTGFQLLESLGNRNFHLIMVTGFESYAIKAIRFSAIDFLVKPVDIDDFTSCINRLQAKSDVQSLRQNIQIAQKGYYHKEFETIALPNMNGFNIVKLNDILSIEADGAYVRVNTTEQTYMVSKLIKELEELLPEDRFFRIHKSTIINLSEVREYIKGKGGSVLMHDGRTFDVSSRRKDALLKLLM